MDRKTLNPWIVASVALALALLLCDSNMLLVPFFHTRKPLLPSILTPIVDWMDLGPGPRIALADLFIWRIPLTILVTNLTILIIAQGRQWRPLWLAWVALSVPAAMLGSVLMACAASLMIYTSILPLPCAGAAFGLLMLAVAKRKGWRPLWPWWLIFLIPGSYVFLVLLALALARVGVVHHLL
jgi:hypothetical protein